MSPSGTSGLATAAPATLDVWRDSGVARHPDQTGVATSPDGTRLVYDVYGSGPPTVMLLPSTPIIHARQWKAQIHFLSRTYRVVAYDGRGNGRSDRPTEPSAYAGVRFVEDIAAVMDATDTPEAVLVGLCADGVWAGVQLAIGQPERVQGLVAFAVGVPRLTPPHPFRVEHSFEDELPTDEGWAKVNRHYWQRDYPGFARWFFGEITSEPHSSKAIDDAVEWTLDGSLEAMLAESEGNDLPFDREQIEAMCRSIRAPMLLVHGTEDRCQPLSRAQRFAELTGAPLVTVEGANHMIPGRHPVLANLLIRQFIRSLEEDRP